MRFISEKGKPCDWRGEWVDWFAWFPLILYRGSGTEMQYAIFWLERVRRRRRQTWEWGMTWEYEWED
jgi:hypothetical protein